MMKKTSLVLGMVVALSLVGCGGSNDAAQDGAVLDKENFDEFYKFDFYVPLSVGDEGVAFPSDGAKYQRVNNILYASPIGLNLTQEFNELVGLGYTLTDDGLYQSDMKKYADGYKLENIIAIENESLITTPYNVLSYNGLQKKVTVKWFDLSGKPATERTNVFWTKIIDIVAIDGTSFFFGGAYELADNPLYLSIKEFVDTSRATRFPKGAACFKVISETPNKPYITFNTKGSSGDNINEWINSQNGKIISGVWAGYKWATTEAELSNGSKYNYTVVDFNNKLTDDYSTVYHDGWTLKKELLETQQDADRLKNSDDERSKKITEFQVEDIRESCTGYNKIAADTILEIRKNLIENLKK